MSKGDVQWYGDRVRGDVAGALDEAIRKIAFDIEAASKMAITDNQQIDTGFMRNSVYTHVKGQGVGGGTGSGQFINSEGQLVKRESASPADLGDADAIVGVGAVYAIYQELKQSFLRVPFERVIGAAGGTVRDEFQGRGF